MENKITEALKKARALGCIESVQKGTSMREIDQQIRILAREYDLSLEDQDWAKQEAYASYIIACEILKVVPKAGY